jgi:hypothetical protein
VTTYLLSGEVESSTRRLSAQMKKIIGVLVALLALVLASGANWKII